MNKKVVVIVIVSIFILSAIFLFSSNRLIVTNYSYSIPKDKTCDFSEKSICEKNNCMWKTLTDIINENPMPATCCPVDARPNQTGRNNIEDPCSWVIG